MAAQAVKSKNTISLKGSAQLVSEYFNFAVNNILYSRGIYPAQSFTQHTEYGLPMMMSTDKALKQYIESVTKQMQTWLETGDLQRVVMVVNHATTQEVLERWTFDVETDKDVLAGKKTAEKPLAAIKKEIANLIRQISSSMTFLPLLDEACTFDLLVYTNVKSEVPSEWEESNAQVIPNAQAVKLRSFSTKVHTVDAYVAYKKEDTDDED